MNLYRGSCHCGRIRFTVKMNLDHVRVCDCSVCAKRGALNHRVPKDHLALETSWEELTLYQWGTKTAKDYFCTACGVLPFRRPSDPSPREVREGLESFDGWAVNVRCLHDVDFDSLPKRYIRGSALELANT